MAPADNAPVLPDPAEPIVEDVEDSEVEEMTEAKAVADKKKKVRHRRRNEDAFDIPVWSW